MRRLILGLAFVACLTGTASAEPTARQLELSARYMKALKLNETIDQMMKTMMPALVGQLTRGRDVPQEGQTILTELVTETMSELIPKMGARMEVIVAETWTEEELTQAVAFYESPVGRSIIAKGPEVNAKFTPAIQPLIREAQTKMMERLLERVCGGGGCKEPARSGA